MAENKEGEDFDSFITRASLTKRYAIGFCGRCGRKFEGPSPVEDFVDHKYDGTCYRIQSSGGNEND
jgi:hypothetical protein